MSKVVKSVTKILGKTIVGSMIGLGKEDKPEAAPTVQAPGPAPTAVSDETESAREAFRKRQLAAAGLGGTNLTGTAGLGGPANTAMKSLLGS